MNLGDFIFDKVLYKRSKSSISLKLIRDFELLIEHLKAPIVDFKVLAKHHIFLRGPRISK